MNDRIWLSPPHLTGEELDYMKNALSTNLIATQGESIVEFENKIKTYLGAPEVLALNSGTSAIHLGLIALGVEKGDEVICQSFTFSATANPILYLGAIPIFVDSEETTWNLCPKLLKEAIEDRIKKGKKPKAIIAVHLYGMPYLANEIQAISDAYGIPILEDAAEALGSTYRGVCCGSLGKIAVLSFNGNKIITTSAGGAIICENSKIKQKLKHLASQAKDDAVHYQHSKVGYNYGMSNVLAGMGIAQLSFLADRIKGRRSNFQFYKENLSQRVVFLEEENETTSNRWLSCMICDSYETREKLRLALDGQNIEAKPLWKPLHLQPVFINYPAYVNGISENLFKKGLCLPSGSNLTETQLNRICKTINSVIRL